MSGTHDPTLPASEPQLAEDRVLSVHDMVATEPLMDRGLGGKVESEFRLGRAEIVCLPGYDSEGLARYLVNQPFDLGSLSFEGVYESAVIVIDLETRGALARSLSHRPIPQQGETETTLKFEPKLSFEKMEFAIASFERRLRAPDYPYDVECHGCGKPRFGWKYTRLPNRILPGGGKEAFVILSVPPEYNVVTGRFEYSATYFPRGLQGLITRTLQMPGREGDSTPIRWILPAQ